MIDIPLTITPEGVSGLNLAGPADSLASNVYLSLLIDRGTFFAAPDFGMRRRRRLKNTPQSARIIEADARDALQWLLDTGRAVAIAITSERDPVQHPYRLKLLVAITRGGGQSVAFQLFVEVV